jgi:hypothetical protein
MKNKRFFSVFRQSLEELKVILELINEVSFSFPFYGLGYLFFTFFFFSLSIIVFSIILYQLI